jgi:hypothetical protein
MRTAISRLPLLALAGSLVANPLAAQQVINLPERDKALTGEPTPVFAVGKEEGESWEMLSNVSAVAFDRQDNLYILDSGNFRVLVFDRSGKYVRQIGKQGNGPGELTFPMALAVASDGNLVIADMGRGGFAVFKSDGSYVKNVAGPEGYRPGAGGVYLDPQGNAIFRTMQVLRGGPGQAPPTGPTTSPILRTAVAENATPTTLYEIPMPAPKVQESGSGGRVMRMVMFAPPTFAPPAVWGALPNGSVVVAHDPEYAIKLVDPSGRVANVIQRSAKPRRVTRRDQEAAREQRRKQLENPSGSGQGVRITNNNGATSFGWATGGGAPQMTKDQIEQQLREMTFADVMPMIRSLRTDPLGRIWVERTPEQVDGDAIIDLLGPDGRYLGSLSGQTLPNAVSNSGLAAYIERNDLDVQQVAVRRLPSAWSVGLPAARGVGDR